MGSSVIEFMGVIVFVPIDYNLSKGYNSNQTLGISRVDHKEGILAPPVTSKQLVRALFQRKDLARTPFIPIITSFAAKLAQIPVRDLLTNPTKLANTLHATHRLLGHDAITAIYDPAIEAEACGCAIDWPADHALSDVVTHPLAGSRSAGELDLSDFHQRGRIPIALEAFRRVAAVAGRDVGMIAMVTGPVTLAGHLRGSAFFQELREEPETAAEVLEAAGKVVTTMARLYCDLKADGILIADPALADLDPRALPAVSSVYQSAANIVRFYDAALLFLPGEVGADHHSALCQFEADAILLGSEGLAESRTRFAEEGRGVGGLLPPSVLCGSKEEVKTAVSDFLRHGSKRGFFVSTAGEVPYQTPVENMQEIVRLIKSA